MVYWWQFINVYIHDLSADSPELGERTQRQTALFQCRPNGWTVAIPDRYGHGKTELRLLGPSVTRQDTEFDDDNVHGNLDCAIPFPIKELEAFQRLVKFRIHSFTKGFSTCFV